MDTTTITVDGLELVVPAFLSGRWPDIPHDRFPRFCGPGSGFADRLIPETMYGLRTSAECFIHDVSWCISQPTWADFHHANSVFLHNLLAVIDAKSCPLLKGPRRNRALFYFTCVDTAGAYFFWKDKENIGRHDNPLFNPLLIEKMDLVGVKLDRQFSTQPGLL